MNKKMGGSVKKLNLKLRLLSYWMPEYLLNPLIDEIAESTIHCLNQLLEIYGDLKEEDVVLAGDLIQRREIMATTQHNRIRKLIKLIGYREACENGRKALFQVGLKLGRQACERLNVTDNLDDLTSAARILYHVLGIEFQITTLDNEIFLIVMRCALAEYYTVETCKIISAVDEGVIQGLNPHYNMHFTEYMTGDSNICQACINMNK